MAPLPTVGARREGVLLPASPQDCAGGAGARSVRAICRRACVWSALTAGRRRRGGNDGYAAEVTAAALSNRNCGYGAKEG